MKKIIFTITITLSILTSSFSFAMDPKLKVLLTSSGYGVACGTLLGTASLAFGTSGRAIAKGASLGLYAGLLFGAYIITSYELKKRGYNNDQKDNYYPESQGPYEDSYYNQMKTIEDYELAGYQNKKDPKSDPLLSVNLFTYQF